MTSCRNVESLDRSGFCLLHLICTLVLENKELSKAECIQLIHIYHFCGLGQALPPQPLAFQIEGPLKPSFPWEVPSHLMQQWISRLIFFWSFIWVETGALETISLDIDNTYRM